MMRFSTAISGLLLALSWGAAAHDIPNDVTVQMFLKPAGDKLDVLVRVPVKSMRDTDFPKLGPGYLDLTRADQYLQDAATVWLARAIEVYEGDSRLPEPRLLAVRASLESDKSFASFEAARANITGSRLPESTQVPWDQTMLDAWLEYPIHSDRSEFSIRPGVERLGLRVVTVLRFLPPGGAIRAFEFEGDPGVIRLDPRWYQASLRFVQAGFLHILDGTDHLLFLLCLVIPFRQFRQLLLIVTSFTVAHSLTLIASAYGLGPDALWFPRLIETLIAMSILYMALENIVGASSVSRRWIVTFAFGLVHGFGFSFALRQTLQFAGTHLLTSLLSFNLGVGYSLGDALEAIDKVIANAKLPASVIAGYQGTAAAYQASQANEGILILAALVTVYIVLGVLYESFIHPLTILSTLPSAGVGALLALRLSGLDLDIVGIIGIILLIGIVQKNGIMMVDFALELERKEHKETTEAIYQAALLRFRPILMTTLAALLSGIPLAFGTGIGSELRKPLGVAMVGGLLFSQVLTLYTTPVIYIFFDRVAARFSRRRREAAQNPQPEGGAA